MLSRHRCAGRYGLDKGAEALLTCRLGRRVPNPDRDRLIAGICDLHLLKAGVGSDGPSGPENYTGSCEKAAQFHVNPPRVNSSALIH